MLGGIGKEKLCAVNICPVFCVNSFLFAFATALTDIPMISISACIITYNEERNIGRCLLALQGIVDEVIIVDSFSTDRTREIAEEMGAKVVTRAFTGYGEQKYFAQELASHHWVLSVDADEIVSADLAQSLLAVKVQPQHDAYTVDILPNYCGAWIRHCGWYPQPKLRLWNREKRAWPTAAFMKGFSFLRKVLA